MESPDLSYAPQSPDAYSYEPEPLPQQHQKYRGSISFTPTDVHSQNPFFAGQQSPPESQQRAQAGEVDKHWQPDPRIFTDAKMPMAESDPEYNEMAVEKAVRPRGVKQEKSIKSETSFRPDGPIDVKTKFPVARIKRIMQADEDVGKVAQVTPVVVCKFREVPSPLFLSAKQPSAAKALELFMISLVTKAAAEARDRASKRVTTAHLKQAVMKDEQFDFLHDIVGKVADAPAPSEKTDDEGPQEGKKKRGAGRKRKKGDDSDD